MTYQISHHRWPDEQAWDDALLIAQTDPAVLEGVTLDVIGVIHEATADTVEGAEGEPMTVMAALPGFHVNVARMDGTPLPEGWAATEVFPATPHRVFA
jgi:hypothetical protein